MSSFFTRKLESVARRMDQLAGVPAVYISGEVSIALVVHPVRVRADFLAEGVDVRRLYQDFYLNSADLRSPDGSYIQPKSDDLIELVGSGERFQVAGGRKGASGIPSRETFISDGKRLLVHTVRIREVTNEQS